MELYHRDVYFPDYLKTFPTQQIKIDTISAHANLELGKEINKFNYPFTLPKVVEANTENVIEVEVVDGIIRKLVIRTSLSDELDLVLVICKNTDNVVLKTLWLNKKEDTHKTLDKTKYTKE